MSALISKERLDALKKRRKDFDESRGTGNLPPMEAGVYIMDLVSVKVGETGPKSKLPGRKRLEFVWQDTAKKHREVKEFLCVEGEEDWVDIHVQKILSRMEHLGLPEVSEIASAQALANHVARGVGKKLKAAVGSKQRLWDRVHEGKHKVTISVDNEIAYTGKTSEDLAQSFDVSRYKQTLSEEDRVRFARHNGGELPAEEIDGGIDEGLGDEGGIEETNTQEAPFDTDETPAPVAKKKAAPKKQEVDFNDLENLEL